MSGVSVVLIVQDEETKIEACLRSVSFADEIIVVDGGSKDRTTEITRKFTSKVYSRPFDHFSNQKNYGLEQATGDWILSLDADEVVSEELKNSILQVMSGENSYNGFWVHRSNFLFGKFLRFAGQREKILRFFRKGKGKFIQPIHEKLQVEGKIGELQGELLHYSSSTVADYLKKLRLYTDLEVEWLSRNGKHVTTYDWAVKPVLVFIYNYFFRLGFLDGFEGFLYHALSSFNLQLKYARLKEREVVNTGKEKSADTPSFSLSR